MRWRRPSPTCRGHRGTSRGRTCAADPPRRSPKRNLDPCAFMDIVFLSLLFFFFSPRDLIRSRRKSSVALRPANPFLFFHTSGPKAFHLSLPADFCQRRRRMVFRSHFSESRWQKHLSHPATHLPNTHSIDSANM